MTLYLYENHSYYNRKIVRYQYPWQYDEDLGPSSAVMSSVTFNPNNGITTTQIINYDIDSVYADGSYSPSYCLVCDTDGKIVSRWWITGHTRIRNGQFSLSLLRDVIADYFDEVMSAPSFVRKGYITTINDPAIYNNEDMAFNQIKQSETLIKDITNSAWYVGFLKRNRTQIPINVPKSSTEVANTFNNWEQYDFGVYRDTPMVGSYNDLCFKIYYGSFSEYYAIGWDQSGKAKRPAMEGTSNYAAGTVQTSSRKGYNYYQGPTGTIANIALGAASGIDWLAGLDAITGKKTDADIQNLLKEDGKIYQVENKYYKISIQTATVKKSIAFDNANIYTEKFKAVAKQVINKGHWTDEVKNNIAGLEMEYVSYKVVAAPTDIDAVEGAISGSRCQLDDQPYDMFAIPADSVKYGSIVSSPDISKRVVEYIIQTVSDDSGDGGTLIDVQLLPYCPLGEEFLAEGEVFPNGLPNVEGYDFISAVEDQTFIIYSTTSSFTKQIFTDTISVPESPMDFKIANETDMYRLCSPNYNGQFEFSVTKNGGVSGWNIAFTYKPFTPYIKVSPIFGRLYGGDFGDARGLICGGDFSLTQLSNAWKTYEINNKNYQVMFDRQIQNMEVNNSVQRNMDIVNGITGTLSGAASGAMAGMMTGNPYAAIGGGIAGGIASAVGGIADYRLNEKLRNEQMSYAKDMFGYNLQNIKAIPNSITKISSRVVDNKIFPFVEYYTCSKIEKQALHDKLVWNGMTIMRIGEFREFLRGYYTEEGNFIQGQPIRLDYLGEDSQVAEVIAAELQTGVYIL